MYAVRRFVVNHARWFERIYDCFEPLLVFCEPLWRLFGYSKLERPVAAAERVIKGFLFDCQMCGQCVLSSTGMSCPMNCPKTLRNGPCGGVRENGHCEVKPGMKCVWIDAWVGSSKMKRGDRIMTVQPPVDMSLKGSSSWLRVAREKAEARRATLEASRHALAAAFPEARAEEPGAAPIMCEPDAIGPSHVVASRASGDEAGDAQ